MKRDYAAVHKAADYFEPLFRASLRRAMLSLRKQITIEHLARAITLRDSHPIPRAMIQAALMPSCKIIRDAFRQGGKLGAEKVRNL